MAAENKRVFVNVGSGAGSMQGQLPFFPEDDWQEMRLDIDPDVKPDVIASITDLSPIEDASVDAVFSSHNLEHVYAHEVTVALTEFKRILRPGGFIVVTMPDMQAIAKVLAEDDGYDRDLIRVREHGVLSGRKPLDIIYGWPGDIQAGRHYMQHKCGFTPRLLDKLLMQSGFQGRVIARGRLFDLWGVGVPEQTERSVLEEHYQNVLIAAGRKS